MEDGLSVAFVGAGNMAQSIIRGLIANGVPVADLRAADPAQAARDAAAELGISVSADNTATTESADVVVLAVKPQVAGDVTRELQLQPEQLVVSIAAGINLDSLASWLPGGQAIVRCMPNTPALLRAGMSALYANANTSQGQREQAELVLRAVGATVWVDEERQLDAVTAVSGSGPAYFFMLMEAMIDAGVQLGLSQPLAEQLTLQTAYGAALMAQESDASPATLRANVTSPGGTTEKALGVMQDREVSGSIVAALLAAEARARELAEEFGAPQ